MSIRFKKKYFLSDFHIFEEVNNICFNLLASYYLNIIVFKFPFWKEKSLKSLSYTTRTESWGKVLAFLVAAAEEWTSWLQGSEQPSVWCSSLLAASPIDTSFPISLWLTNKTGFLRILTFRFRLHLISSIPFQQSENIISLLFTCAQPVKQQRVHLTL